MGIFLYNRNFRNTCTIIITQAILKHYVPNKTTTFVAYEFVLIFVNNTNQY